MMPEGAARREIQLTLLQHGVAQMRWSTAMTYGHDVAGDAIRACDSEVMPDWT